tara:strand:- start:618 stop:875 length:258 start_codon:yes stop_codon:yes gene_type:complete
MKKLIFSIIECNEITYKIIKNSENKIILINFIFEPQNVEEVMDLPNDEKLLKYLEFRNIDIEKLNNIDTIEIFCEFMNVRELFQN